MWRSRAHWSIISSVSPKMWMDRWPELDSILYGLTLLINMVVGSYNLKWPECLPVHSKMRYMETKYRLRRKKEMMSLNMYLWRLQQVGVYVCYDWAPGTLLTFSENKWVKMYGNLINALLAMHWIPWTGSITSSPSYGVTLDAEWQLTPNLFLLFL